MKPRPPWSIDCTTLLTHRGAIEVRAAMTSERIERLRNSAGYTISELLVAVAIFAVLAASGLPHIDTRRHDLQSTTQQLISDYRWARSRAITSGVHFALKWTSQNAYQIQRLEQVGTDWTLDEVVKQVTLPAWIRCDYGAVSSLEFNTRGMMISTASTNFQDLEDTKFNTERRIAVWPSGQVNAYE
jgi:prepilin-type N-terminal cleavage/methylation domain-containing protein